MNVTKALDEHIETELKEARDAASRLMAQTVAAYQLVTELEMARDLRRTLGADLRPVLVAATGSLRAVSSGL